MGLRLASNEGIIRQLRACLGGVLVTKAPRGGGVARRLQMFAFGPASWLGTSFRRTHRGPTRTPFGVRGVGVVGRGFD